MAKKAASYPAPRRPPAGARDTGDGGRARAGKGASPSRAGRSGPLAQNRKARHLYEILETFECGIVLSGSEIKSIRAGKIQLAEAYARIDRGEAWLVGAHIAPYAFAQGDAAHDPVRARKLLLHRREIDELAGKVAQKSLTLVPLSVYLRDGRAKLEIGLARGRHAYDRRRDIAERDAKRDMERAVSMTRTGKGARTRP